MNTDKQELRSMYKQIRLAMDADEAAVKSRVICQRIIENVDWQAIKSVSAFRPITKLNEVRLDSLLTDVSQHYPYIKVNIMGRSKNTKIPHQKFDLVLVPCLAFDKDNYRLGWGGGFYDRFLAQQPQALKIGVCFQNGFVDAGLSNRPHDVPLNKIITEI